MGTACFLASAPAQRPCAAIRDIQRRYRGLAASEPDNATFAFGDFL